MALTLVANGPYSSTSKSGYLLFPRAQEANRVGIYLQTAEFSSGLYRVSYSCLKPLASILRPFSLVEAPMRNAVAIQSGLALVPAADHDRTPLAALLQAELWR
jgi:hypothetical protein